MVQSCPTTEPRTVLNETLLCCVNEQNERLHQELLAVVQLKRFLIKTGIYCSYEIITNLSSLHYVAKDTKTSEWKIWFVCFCLGQHLLIQIILVQPSHIQMGNASLSAFGIVHLQGKYGLVVQSQDFLTSLFALYDQSCCSHMVRGILLPRLSCS